MLECEKVEVLKGVLYYEDAADPARWCKAVETDCLCGSSCCYFQRTLVRTEGVRPALTKLLVARYESRC